MQVANYQIVKLTSNDIIEEIPRYAPVNHIWIYDRSGSMEGTLVGLCDNIIAQAKLLKIGDTLTICWFSGEGQNDCILKGFKISDQDDYHFIERALLVNNTVVGSTCFSESFVRVKSIISDLKSIFSSRVVLCLFTDGYPVVGNYQKELGDLFDAILEIKNSLDAVLLIGYGESYNKELLLNMAGKLNGTVIHSSCLDDTSKTMTEFIEDSIVLQRSTIPYPRYENIMIACSVSHNKVFVHDIDQAKTDGQFSIVGSDLYLLVSDQIEPQLVEDTIIYALAACLVQQTKTDVALQLLNSIGDKYLMDLIMNAFTNSEYGNAEKAILLAMSDGQFRYRNGVMKNYLPDENAFCLLNLLFSLMEDKEAKFYPKHPVFKYKKIGKSNKVKDGYEKFVADKNVAVPISNMTWHKDKLNLSLLCKIPGTVCITSSDDELIAEAYPTFQYRNYTIVKNAILNFVNSIFICSKDTINKLIENGIQIENDDGINIVALNSIPFINRKLVDDRMSAKVLANKAVEALRLEAKMKVFNNKNPKIKMINGISAELSDRLISKGFRADGSYNPPVESVKNSELTDYYLAKTLKIKIKGGSTIPKVDTVESKIKTKKKLNFVEEFMKEALDECDHVEDIQKTTKKELRDARKYIQETKFALILSKRWFNEFDNFMDCTIDTDDGHTVTFERGEEKIMID